MKIIKQGKIPTYMTFCPECGCQFEFVSTEIKKEVDNERGITSTYVECPCCGFEIGRYFFVKKTLKDEDLQDTENERWQSGLSHLE